MHDIIVDLETMGNSAGCVLLSIGAVAFDPETGQIDHPGFYTVVNVRSQVVAGLRFDQDTLNWWDKQSEAARAVIKEAYAATAPTLDRALSELNSYLNRFGGKKKVRIWGNGADFDNPILVAAYRAAGIGLGWEFWNSRCYRTLKNLHPEVPLQARTGTFHNALDDAKTQAIHALRIFGLRAKHVRGLIEPMSTAVSNDLGSREMANALQQDRDKLESLGADPGPTEAELALEDDLIG